jgi:hypothetical protein
VAGQDDSECDVAYMKASTLYSVLSSSRNKNIEQIHLGAYRRFLRSGDRLKKYLPGKRPAVTLIEGTKCTPEVVLTAAQDAYPSIDYDTWLELDCPQFSAIDMDVCMPYAPSIKKKRVEGKQRSSAGHWTEDLKQRKQKLEGPKEDVDKWLEGKLRVQEWCKTSWHLIGSKLEEQLWK